MGLGVIVEQVKGTDFRMLETLKLVLILQQMISSYPLSQRRCGFGRLRLTSSTVDYATILAKWALMESPWRLHSSQPLCFSLCGAGTSKQDAEPGEEPNT